MPRPVRTLIALTALLAIPTLARAQSAATAAVATPDPQAHVLALVQAGKCDEAHDAATAAKLDSLADQIAQMCSAKPTSGGRKGGGGGGRGGGGRRGGGGGAQSSGAAPSG